MNVLHLEHSKWRELRGGKEPVQYCLLAATLVIHVIYESMEDLISMLPKPMWLK